MPTFRYSSKPNRFAVVAGAMCCAVWLASAVEGQQRVREPLPLDIAVATNAPDTRSAFDLSPDGEWLAHTWAIDEAVPAGRFYTATGVSFAEGNNRKQAGITRSEEHTSELQSRLHLVCRLLLEKKKNKVGSSGPVEHVAQGACMPHVVDQLFPQLQASIG